MNRSELKLLFLVYSNFGLFFKVKIEHQKCDVECDFL
jgi:hypothetical protein